MKAARKTKEKMVGDHNRLLRPGMEDDDHTVQIYEIITLYIFSLSVSISYNYS
jgi:hypothetical protein